MKDGELVKKLPEIAYGLETDYFHERSPSVAEFAARSADRIRAAATRISELEGERDERDEALEEINSALTAWDADEPFQDPGEPTSQAKSDLLEGER